MQKLIKSAVVVVAVASFVVAVPWCPPKPRQPSHDPLCDLQVARDKDRAEGDCHSSTCGGNSPIVNSFPFNGLHPEGCLNVETAQLSLRDDSVSVNQKLCGPHRADLYLDFAEAKKSGYAGYQLVARSRSDAEFACEARKMVGATFTIVANGTEHRFQIGHIGTTRARTPESRTAAPPALPAPPQLLAYLITPIHKGSQSVCAAPLAVGSGADSEPILHSPGDARIRSEPATPATDSSRSADIEPEDLPLYTIIVPGAVYGPNAALVKGSAETWKPGERGPSRWFNIACSSDALAQTALSGLPFKPISDRKTASDRLPALHMFTGKYNHGYSATVHGNPVAWSADNLSSNKDAVEHGQVEAFWGNDGAVCVHHSRMWIDNKIVALPSHLTKLFKENDAHYPMTEAEFIGVLIKNSNPEITYPCREPTGDDFKKYLISFVVNHVDGIR